MANLKDLMNKKATVNTVLFTDTQGQQAEIELNDELFAYLIDVTLKLQNDGIKSFESQFKPQRDNSTVTAKWTLTEMDVDGKKFYRISNGIQTKGKGRTFNIEGNKQANNYLKETLVGYVTVTPWEGSRATAWGYWNKKDAEKNFKLLVKTEFDNIPKQQSK